MTNYRLLVDMYVPQDDAPKFEERMGYFLNKKGGFRFFSPDFDNELVFALKGLAPSSPQDFKKTADIPAGKSPAARFLAATQEPYRDPRPGSQAPLQHYVHLWTVPDLGDLDLAARMQFCSEDKEYMHLDELVVQETQNFVRRVCWLEQPSKPQDDMHFVRATRRLTYSKLGSYLLQLRALTPSLKLRGWDQLGQFQAVTGTLNTVTEFWQTKKLGALDPSSFAKGSHLGVRAMKVATDPISVQLETFKFAPYFKPDSFRALRSRFLQTRTSEKVSQ